MKWSLAASLAGLLSITPLHSYVDVDAAAGVHLDSLKDQLSVATDIINNHMIVLDHIEVEDSERSRHLDQEYVDAMTNADQQMRDLEILSVDIPHIETGFGDLFMKSPVRVNDIGMFNTPILLPHVDTANTAGFLGFHFGVTYKTSTQHVISPKTLDPNSLFVDVNDLDFTGFGDIKWIAAINGTVHKLEVNGVFGVTSFFDIGVRLPIVSTPEYVLYKADTYEDYVVSQGSAGKFGDLEAWAKWRLFSSPGNYVKGAVKADIRLPTGDRDSLLGLGTPQYALSYIVTLQPYEGLWGNFTLGFSYSSYEAKIFRKPIKLSPVVYSGVSIINRVHKRLSVLGQLETFSNPWKSIDTDIFNEGIGLATGGLKYSGDFTLGEISISRGLTRASPDYVMLLNIASRSKLDD